MHILKTKLQQMKLAFAETEALQTQSSLHSVVICDVRSRYFKTWTKREIYVSLDEKLLCMICTINNKKKSYNLDQVSYTRNSIQQTIRLRVSPSRSYDIKVTTDLQEILNDIDYFHNFKLFGVIQQELKSEAPRKISYQSMHKKQNFIEPTLRLSNKKSAEEKKDLKIEKLIVKPLVDYQRLSSYIKQSDWKRDKKNGGLIFINKQKKHIISQMISYTAKKIVSSGSFTTINFPTFAMKPESALQSYCNCLGAAPLILQNIPANPIQRIKAFNAIILTISIQLNDIEKPFNSLLGQTFQGQIGGYPVYGQQISTKPNVSCFLLVGKDYKLYGNLELKANIGLNQAVGVFHGQITLQFNDGNKIVGIMPKGVMSGVIFGDTKFGPTGSVYSYDPINKLVCSYDTIDGDEMIGQIGVLKSTPQHRFEKKVKGKNVQDFPYFAQKDFQTIVSRLKILYTEQISYDGKLYFNYSSKKNLPIKLTQLIKQKILESDSKYREDIKLRKANNIKDSQKLNDMIELEQQRTRKLRKYKQ